MIIIAFNTAETNENIVLSANPHILWINKITDRDVWDNVTINDLFKNNHIVRLKCYPPLLSSKCLLKFPAIW